MTIKEAIAEYIHVRAERLKPCEHDWEIIYQNTVSTKTNLEYKWAEIAYVCKKCKETKFVSSKNPELWP